jgi:thymidylate synthase (FAD)
MEIYYNVLDKGFIRLVDMMGDDMSVVRAARVSYGLGTKGVEQDKKLIFYLMQHGHETPFEHVVYTFHVKAPIFVARQWFRHRIGSFNEISQRYTEIKEEEFYIPENVRVNVPEDRQKAVPVEDEELLKKVQDIMKQKFENDYKLYKELLNMGIARELARIVLPLSTYTQFYWTVNLRSLINFLMLRIDEHAQYEIREYAKCILDIIKQTVPWTYEALTTYKHIKLWYV